MSLIFDWARTAGHVDGVNPGRRDHCRAAEAAREGHAFGRVALAGPASVWPRLEADESMGSAALRFAILTAARSGEVRGATWSEIDFEAAVWTVPAARMKMGKEHKVPLSDPALAILREVRPLDKTLCFPGRDAREAARGHNLGDGSAPARGPGDRARLPLDVPRLGRGGSDLPARSEGAALAHSVRNPVEAAYRRGDLLEQRRPLMDSWARFVTGGGSVVSLRAVQ